MIPHQLTLHNFLSYRDTVELDLRGVHLACISGLNGAGKSTILDGITWALFGKSRVKSDDDIVNRGAGLKAAAEVTFVFELEGALYRVIRRKPLGKTTELEFHAFLSDGEGDGRWQVKTEARTRETQVEIERLLRMNYDVFTNASFLLQGRADEFTTKTPDKRKEILAEILGVSLWDDYKEIATESRKLIENDVAMVERQLTDVEAELAQEAEYVRSLEAAQARVTLISAERDRQEALLTLARQNKAQADQQRNELRRIAAEQTDAEQECRRVEELAARYQEELTEYRTLLGRREGIEAANQAWQAAEAEMVAWQAKAEAHNRITLQMHPLQTAIANAESRLSERARELGIREQHVKAESIRREELEAQSKTIRANHEQLTKQASELADRQHEWEEAAERLRTLEVERHRQEMELEQLRALAQEMGNRERERVQVEQSRQAASTALDNLRERFAELEDQRRQSTRYAEQRSRLEAEQGPLAETGKRLNDRLDRLASDSESECPVCRQPLTEEHRRNVIHESEQERDELRAKYRDNKTLIDDLSAKIAALEQGLKQQTVLEKDRETRQGILARAESRLNDIDASLQSWHETNHAARLHELEAQESDTGEMESLRAGRDSFRLAAEEARKVGREVSELAQRMARLDTQLEESEQRNQEWLQTGLPALQEARDRLAQGGYAEEERAALNDLQRQLAAVGFDSPAFEAVRARRDDLTSAPEAYQQLLKAEAAVRPLEDALIEYTRQRERLAARVVELRDRAEVGEQKLQELEGATGDLSAAEAELNRLREETIAANQAVGAARQRIAVIDVRREDRKQLIAEKTALAQRAGLLRRLEEACGRKGVQALLIEHALPEIEDYANDLLESLTGGEMRIVFDTQRSSKSKQDSLIETLDIRISDSNGERPYENYSGGEKFRVNFAIRLALSQVLARRAGARLRTLVIDEGFGSQDPDGRQKLVEAINVVQSEFACILVITHIDELRDKFPARIDVEKTATGSRLSVVAI